MDASSNIQGSGNRWLLLIHQLPAKPAYLRVKVWRRLQTLGAVPVKNAVYALPANEQAQEDFEWLLREIGEGGGEAFVCEARLIDGLSDHEVRALFDHARDADYEAIAKEARTIAEALGADGPSPEQRTEARTQLTRLKARLAQAVAIDFFGANGREAADGLLADLDAKLAEDESLPEPVAPASSIGDSEGPRLGHAARRACRPHRIGMADPALRRPRRPVQVRASQGLPTGAGRGALRHVRGRVHPRGRPLHFRGPVRANGPRRAGAAGDRRDRPRHRPQGRQVRARRGRRHQDADRRHLHGHARRLRAPRPRCHGLRGLYQYFRKKRG